MNDIKIILADDHNIVRAGIKAILEKMSNIKIVAEASNGKQVLNIIKEIEPDIVLLDIAMPELNGLEVTQQISKNYPNIKVIILSMYKSEEYVLQALKFGASGYLLKDSAVDELLIAINAVVKGDKYLSPFVSKSVIENLLVKSSDKIDIKKSDYLLNKLTPRQREIFQLIAEGYTSKEIAYKLKISPKTVEAHRKQLMTRLGIYDIAGLVKYAIKLGIISSEQ